MPIAAVNHGTIWKPEEKEQEQAKKASGALAAIYKDFQAHKGDSERFFKHMADSHIVIPPTVIDWMLQILKEVALGNSVTLIPVHAELTTQEAADFLNVSRPYLVGLLEQGKIQFRKVGRHRRVLFGDLFEYKTRLENEQRKLLADINARSQEIEGDDFDLKDIER